MVVSAADDRLADELQHQPQHAVRAGVLRPHVDGHRLGAQLRVLELGHDQSSIESSTNLADRVDQRPVHFLHARGRGVGHVDVDVGERARPRRRRGRSARWSCSPRARAASQARDHVRRIGRWSRCRTRRRRAGRAPRSAARTRARTRSRWRRSSARWCRSSAPAPATRRRSRWKRPTSSAARCCASAALPPLPNTSTLPPVARTPSTIAAAASAHRLQIRAAHPLVQRDRRRRTPL